MRCLEIVWIGKVWIKAGEAMGLAKEDKAVKRKLVGYKGGLFDDPLDGIKSGFSVSYEGRAPESVVKLRTKSRNLGYVTKTYSRGWPVRQDDFTYKHYNYLLVAATKLDMLAEEIGVIIIEFIEMCKERNLWAFESVKHP